MAKLRFMSIRLSPALTFAEIPSFRGAVIAAAGPNSHLFHNHRGEGYDYRYPLVQYRTMGGKAGLVCINEGIEQMLELLGSSFLLSPQRFGHRIERVDIEDMRINEFEMGVLETPVRYHIARWMAFNQENYHLWQSLESDEERIDKLQRQLIGNIISFAKGIGWQIDGRIEVAIDAESLDIRHSLYKGQQLISINCDFEANIFLPRGIALGKGVALGRGVISIPRE